MFFQVASATATRYGLSRGLLGLKYDQINYSDSDSEVVCQHSWNDETVSNALDGFCYLNDLSIQPNAYGGHVGL